MTNNELIPTPMMSFGASVKTCSRSMSPSKVARADPNTGGSVFSTLLSV